MYFKKVNIVKICDRDQQKKNPNERQTLCKCYIPQFSRTNSIKPSQTPFIKNITKGGEQQKNIRVLEFNI